jgi:hypothetical protein
MSIAAPIISSAFFSALLAFNEFGLDCYVRGYVYRDNATVSLSREDYCDRIEHSVFGEGIVLYSKNYWVYIPVSESVKGHESFYYRWGNERAYIHGVPIKVEWGYVIGG